MDRHRETEKGEGVKMMNTKETLARIERLRELLPLEEQLAQLAEEATELSYAASKCRRAISRVNPTPVTKEEALENLVEEIADVFQCIDVVGVLQYSAQYNRVKEIQSEKYDRWISRIEKGADHG